MKIRIPFYMLLITGLISCHTVQQIAGDKQRSDLVLVVEESPPGRWLPIVLALQQVRRPNEMTMPGEPMDQPGNLHIVIKYNQVTEEHMLQITGRIMRAGGIITGCSWK